MRWLLEKNKYDQLLGLNANAIVLKKEKTLYFTFQRLSIDPVLLLQGGCLRSITVCDGTIIRAI